MGQEMSGDRAKLAAEFVIKAYSSNRMPWGAAYEEAKRRYNVSDEEFKEGLDRYRKEHPPFERER